MKHLRKFNESSSPEDIRSNLENILIDFSDRHIPVKVRHTTVDRKTVCSVRLGDEYADLDMISILLSDNKDEFLRIYDYMKSEGYDFSSMAYDFGGDIVILRVTDIGIGIDSFSNYLFNGIAETCYLALFFRKIE